MAATSSVYRAGAAALRRAASLASDAVAAHQRRVDASGREGIDRDAVGTELARQMLGHADEAGLGRGIMHADKCRRRCAPPRTRWRRCARASGRSSPRNEPHAVEGAGEIDVDDPAPSPRSMAKASARRPPPRSWARCRHWRPGCRWVRAPSSRPRRRAKRHRNPPRPPQAPPCARRARQQLPPPRGQIQIMVHIGDGGTCIAWASAMARTMPRPAR